MKSLVFILISFLTLQAQANSERLCWSEFAPVDTVRCVTLKKPVVIARKLAQYCHRFKEVNERRRCFGLTANKMYRNSEINHCLNGWYLGTAMSCLTKRGHRI